jgi:endoglycosylceramidase
VIALLMLAALHADGAFLRDDAGGAVILRGVNATGDAKVPPFRPLADATTLDPLPRLGANVVRLLFIWEAFEPQPGAYDQSYLDYYAGVAHAAGQRGLYVVVDFHQDAFSRFNIGGCGEGAPQWALPPTVTPATPDNGAGCADWQKRVLADADLKTTWDAFYADSYGARTRFLAMIGQVASALSSEPAVIGYDLLNEPGGDEPTQIAPLQQDEAKVLRAAHPAAILFVSPSVATSAGKQTLLPRPTFDDFVYAPHFYDPVQVLAHSWSGSDESASFAQMSAKAAEWNVPLFLGEWGAPPSTDQVDGLIDAFGTQLDATLASSTQWAYTPGWTPDKLDGWNLEDYSIVDDKGAPRANFVARPYAQRLAGTPTSVVVAAQSLDVTWQNDPGAGATALFVPASWFGGTASVSIDDGQCTVEGDFAQCSSPTAGPRKVHAGPAPRCGLTGAELLLLLLCVRGSRRYLRP